MPKEQIQFVCQCCGAYFPGWQGQCTSCNSWNTLEQESVTKVEFSTAFQKKRIKSEPVSLGNLVLEKEEVIASGIKEFDNVLGKGFVKGSCVLLGGEPGIGKSTLALQAAQQISAAGKKVLYISGEESLNQVYFRAKRIRKDSSDLMVLSETNILDIIRVIEKYEPDFIVMDSIQVVYHPAQPSVTGSVNQVRICTNEIIRIIKERNTVCLIIGHITKDGSLAGPKVLEHIVDVILYIEGDRQQQYRLLRCFKNRYSNTSEIGIFEMEQDGLIEVGNTSKVFIDEVTLANPGSVVSAVAEGRRILLVEIQALVIATGYGMAKRTFLGVDPNRANLMIAAIEKILGIRMADKDIILNVVGGVKIKETALDLGIIMAIISSLKEQSFGHKTGFCGEVGLTGEIRAVPHLERRLIEFEKLGFSSCITAPDKNHTKNSSGKMKRIYVKDIKEAMNTVLS
ncbi:MAG: DNA repair protein RadA [bacterium]|nr:DNA repair protein RadA [bacterium]